jgi:hypothetical protein
LCLHIIAWLEGMFDCAAWRVIPTGFQNEFKVYR